MHSRHPRLTASWCLWLRGLLGLAVPGALTFAAHGANYYVSPAGNDGAPGTFSAPFATVQHAIQTAQPGDTVHLRGGTFRETVEFGSSAGNSGTPGNEIVLKSFGNETAVLSAFEEVVPGQNGAGNWTQHAGDIWKIQLPATWTQNAGENLVMVDGVLQQEARWPNVPDAFNFDYRQMATSESATLDLNSAGPQPPYSGDFYTATYTDSEFPVVADGTWIGAYIDLSPGGGAKALTGIVTNTSGTTIEFRYANESNTSVGSGEPYYLWNHLAALDSPDEAFLDAEGVSGPAHTLYLLSPEGDPSLYHLVEVRTRIPTLLVRVASHLRIEGLVSLGGEIECRSPSSNVTLERITAKYGGAGLNQLSARTGNVSLEGSNLTLRDSYIGHTYGGGVRAGGTDLVIENNVIRRCQEYGIATWGGHNVTANRNTVAENGGMNIAMFSTASEFSYNHCYLAGLHTTDEASMNTNGVDLDLLDTEVSYNWVRDNVSRGGVGRGIRADSGGGGVFNIEIHHNIVWNIAGPNDLTLWALPPTSQAYGNSQIRAYNNTVEGAIKFQGEDPHSIGGHDIRNNITSKLDLVGTGLQDATVTQNLVSNQGFNTGDWPGNIFAPPNFVNGANGNFYLNPDSVGLDNGVIIPTITDGFSGSAPEIGALEYVGPDARVWSAGAITLPSEIAQITLEIEVTPTGQREVLVRNIPEGRVLPDEFALQLGNIVTHHVAYSYSITNHEATATIKFLTTPPQEGFQPISISLDSGTTWIPRGTIYVPPPGVSIDPSALIISDTAGGSTATLGFNGVLSKEKLIPVDILRSLPTDLTGKPVPLVVDTRSMIASGEMNSDGSNVRFRTADSAIELDYWIESGLDSESTLFWLKNKPGESMNGEQLYLALEDPAFPPVSDKTVVTNRYYVLEDPSLCVWYSANSLSNLCDEGDPVALLPDQGARGHDSVQGISGAQPHWNESRIAELPTLSFDGNDFLFSGLISPISPDKVSMIIIHRNEFGTDDTSRIISSSLGGSEMTWAVAGATEDIFVQLSSRRLGPSLDNFTIGKKSEKVNKYFTGEVAEILVFDEELENSSPGRWELVKEYTSRKYALADEARGELRPQDTIEPATLFLGGQEITDFAILPDNSVQFTIPPAASGSSLPALIDIDIISGPQNITLPNALAYYEPNYANWAAPLVGPGLDDPILDIEGDQIVNLFEYLCDLEAQDPDLKPHWLEMGVGGGGEDVTHFYFRRSTTATDALLLIEKTTDLQTWVTLTPEDLGFTVFDANPDGDSSAVLYRAELPVPQPGLEVYRLKAELLSPLRHVLPSKIDVSRQLRHAPIGACLNPFRGTLPGSMTRPTVLINFAITADGKVSTVNKDPAHFTSKADLHRLLEIRKRADAVLVGRGTLEADEMSLTIPPELKPAGQPLRCIVSRSGNFDLAHKVFHTKGGAVHLLATQPAPDYDPSLYLAAGATMHRGPLAGFLTTLSGQHGVETLLCEGGGTLVRALAELDAIDEVNLTFAGHTLFGGADAPTITGHLAPHLPAALEFDLTKFEPLDNGECFLTYRRRARI